jgi:hypothetical protein
LAGSIVAVGDTVVAAKLLETGQLEVLVDLPKSDAVEESLGLQRMVAAVVS